MKKIWIKPVAIAAIALAFIGCQEEAPFEPVPSGPSLSVWGNVSGVTYSRDISNDEEWASFFNSIVSNAKEGTVIYFGARYENMCRVFSKELLVFQTSNVDEASKWTKERVDEGYEVKMYFDKDGIYTCYAYRPDKEK